MKDENKKAAHQNKEVEMKILSTFLPKIIGLTLLLVFFLPIQITAQEQIKREDLYKMSFEDLMNISITTAGKYEQKISDIPASVLIVSRKDIEDYGYKDLYEIFRNLLGMYLTDEKGAFGTGINVRGFWTSAPSNVIIMINGIPQVDERFSIYSLRNISLPVEAIERIEVVRGPMSVIYGSGAFFGAINIITTSDEARGSVSANYGSKKIKGTSVYINRNIGDLKFNMSFNVDHTDGEKMPYKDIMTDFAIYPGFEEKAIPPEGFGHLTKHYNIRGEYKGFYSQLTFAESDFGFQYEFAPSPEVVPEITKEYFAATVGLNKKITDWLRVNAQINNYSSNAERTNFYLPYTQSLVYGYIMDEAKYYDTQLDLFIKPNDKIDITLGANYKSIYKNYGIGDIPILPIPKNYSFRLHKDSKLERYAAYSQLGYKLSEKLHILAGVRLEQESEYKIFHHYGQGSIPDASTYYEGLVPKSDLNIIPRAAVIFKFNDNNILKLMYGKAIRMPSIVNNWDILHSNNDGSGRINPYLNSEKINTLELNYQTVINSYYTINASVFRNSLDNLIVRRSELVQNLINRYYTANEGRLNTNGFESSLLARPIKSLRFELAATYQQTKDPDNENIDVSHSPNLLAYLKAAYELPKPANGRNLVSIAILVNYVDKMYASWDASLSDPNNPNSEPVGRLGEMADSYLLLGANIRVRKFLIKNLSLNLKASNILDTKYHYATSPNAEWADKGLLGNGRYFQAALYYGF